jgi:hypothetical protein
VVLSSVGLHEHVTAEMRSAQEGLVRVRIEMELLYGTGPVVVYYEHSKNKIFGIVKAEIS